MKKQWFILLGCFVLAAVMCLAVSWPRESGGPVLPGGTPSKPTRPSSDTIPSTGGPVPGAVRLYICDREDEAVYGALAEQYSLQTGIACQIVSGDLAGLMAEDSAPTVFCVHSREEAQAWAETMLDLTGSAVLEQLYSLEFALHMDGKPVGLAMDVEGYGLIYNAGLLGVSGFTRADISDFSSLQTAVELITGDRRILGFHAFCQADLSDTVFAGYLAGIRDEPAAVRSFFDLYLANSTASGVPLEQFVEENVVFYVGGVWEYERIDSMGIHSLDILPLYTEDGGSFPCICDTYWSVNVGVSQADISASLDFLNWLVSAGEDGSVPVDSLGWLSPFADATGAETAFERLFRKYMATESVSVSWDIAQNMSAKDLADLSAALAAYAKDPTDELWVQVETLLAGI